MGAAAGGGAEVGPCGRTDVDTAARARRLRAWFAAASLAAAPTGGEPGLWVQRWARAAFEGQSKPLLMARLSHKGIVRGFKSLQGELAGVHPSSGTLLWAENRRFTLFGGLEPFSIYVEEGKRKVIGKAEEESFL